MLPKCLRHQTYLVGPSHVLYLVCISFEPCEALQIKYRKGTFYLCHMTKLQRSPVKGHAKRQSECKTQPRVMWVPDVIFEVLPDVVGGHVAQQFLHRVLTTGSPAAQHMHLHEVSPVQEVNNYRKLLKQILTFCTNVMNKVKTSVILVQARL